MTPIIENIADANARIHELTKMLEAADAEIKELKSDKKPDDEPKQEKLDMKALIVSVLEERKVASSEDVAKLNDRVVSTEKKLALIRPQSDPIKQVSTFPDTGDLEGKTQDELYAIQAELPTWQERQAFFDQYIAPRMEKALEDIKI